MNFGYARVSQDKQHLDRQTDFFAQHGIKPQHIFMEKMTGVRKERPQLDRLKGIIREGDTVYIESLSRLGRSTKDLLELIDYFQTAGVTIVSAKENIDTSTPTGRLLTTLMCALAEFERDLIIERTHEGLKAARARGRKGGRPSVDADKLKAAITMYKSGAHTITEIEKATGIWRSTLYRGLGKDRDTTFSEKDT